jgi:hypothetical protein
MENLNSIEKVTLLVSTSIVCLANLFVLIERTKKSEKHIVFLIIQKLFGFKNTFFVFGLIVVMSSCSGSKFLNRKYTSGRFSEHSKNLKYNTIDVDTTKSYSSLTHHIEFKKSPVSLNSISDKEIINNKVESLIKKDSIFIISRRGRNKKIVKPNNLPTVKVYINADKKKIKTYKELSPEIIKQKQDTKLKRAVIMSLFFSLIPVLGLFFSIRAKKIVRNYQKNYPLENKNKYMAMANLAICISIIPAIAALVAVLFGLLLFFALLFSAFV